MQLQIPYGKSIIKESKGRETKWGNTATHSSWKPSGLSDEIGLKKAAAQLGLPYYTIADWRNNSKHKVPLVEQLTESDADKRIRQLEKENAELREANEILKDALGFFARDRKR